MPNAPWSNVPVLYATRLQVGVPSVDDPVVVRDDGMSAAMSPRRIFHGEGERCFISYRRSFPLRCVPQF